MNFYEKADLEADKLVNDNPEYLRQEYISLTNSGADPLRTMAIAITLGRMMSHYQYTVHMSNAFAGQVIPLLRKGMVLSAWSCLKDAMRLADKTLEIRAYAPKEEIYPFDFVHVGACYFHLSMIPFIGSRYKDKAMTFLQIADRELQKNQPTYPLRSSLILSKMYALTKEETYRFQVQCSGLNTTVNKDQVMHIAKHLGLKSIHQLRDCLR